MAEPSKTSLLVWGNSWPAEGAEEIVVIDWPTKREWFCATVESVELLQVPGGPLVPPEGMYTQQWHVTITSPTTITDKGRWAHIRWAALRMYFFGRRVLKRFFVNV